MVDVYLWTIQVWKILYEYRRPSKIPYKEGEEWDFCIKFDCDGCAVRDNISEILFNLLNNPDNIKTIITYQNYLYVEFGQEKDYLNFLLAGEATCRCSWKGDYIWWMKQ